MNSPTWLNTDFLMALLVGVLVLADVYLLLERVIGFRSPQARRAGGVFAGAAGMLTTLFFLQNPEFLHSVAHRLVFGLLGLLLATIALLRRRIS